MSGIFEGGTIPVPSPEASGHDGATAALAGQAQGEGHSTAGDQGGQNQEPTPVQQTSEGQAAEATPPEAAEGGDGHGEGEELLAGKYKTPQELAKAYLAAQRKITQQAVELKQLRGNQPAAPAPVQQQQMPAPQQQNGADPNEIFWANFEKNPIGTIRYLMDMAAREATTQALTPIMQERQFDQLARNMDSVVQQYTQARTEDGMSQLFGRVAEIAQELGNPSLVENPTRRVLDMAARELWGEPLSYAKGKEKGRLEAEEALLAKQGLAGGVGAGNRGAAQTQPKSAAEQIRESIMAAGSIGGIWG